MNLKWKLGRLLQMIEGKARRMRERLLGGDGTPARERALDEELEETFPASDPLPHTRPRARRG
jgi:hypothetical protein